MGLSYQPQDDTPEQVENVIRKYQQLSVLDKNSEAYARIYARSMMDQADGLARWGEFDEAERLAGRAASVRIVYGPFEQKPQDLLERIAAARRGAAAPRPLRPRAGIRRRVVRRGYAAASSGRDMPARARAGYAGASGPAATPAVQQRAVELVRQAREAIARGQLEQAEALARAADRLRLPDAAFGPGGDRPALVLLDIRQMRCRATRASSPPAGNTSFRRAAAANLTATPPAPSTTPTTTRPATCRPAASSRLPVPIIRGWRRTRTAIPCRRSRPRRPRPSRGPAGRRRRRAWRCSSRARTP